MKDFLAAIGLAVIIMAVLGRADLVQFRMYFGNDFKHFCEMNP